MSDSRKNTREAAPPIAPKWKGRNRRNRFLPALLAGILVGIAMIVICGLGIYSALHYKGALGERGQTRQDALAPSDDNYYTAPQYADSGDNLEDLTEEERALVVQALSELQELAYEESLEPTRDELIMHVDYAIIQAAYQCKLPLGHTRLWPKDGKSHQDVEILPGDDPLVFLGELDRSLDLWAKGATMKEIGPNLIAVYLDNEETHRLHLYPGKTSFSQIAGLGHAFGAGGPADPSDGPGKEKPEPVVLPSRRPGEPALMVIVIDDLGANRKSLNTLLELDYPVTMAFWPFAAHTKSGARRAHETGREVLVHYPMQPVGHPGVDAGPGVLLGSMTADRIRGLVEQGIERVPYAVGLNNHMGSAFTQDRSGIGVVVSVLKEKGLFSLDSLTHGRSRFYTEAAELGIPAFRRNVFLDHERDRKSIIRQLKQAERIANLTGKCIAIGHPLPETLQALKEWQWMRDKSIRLVRLADIRASSR